MQRPKCQNEETSMTARGLAHWRIRYWKAGVLERILSGF